MTSTANKTDMQLLNRDRVSSQRKQKQRARNKNRNVSPPQCSANPSTSAAYDEMQNGTELKDLIHQIVSNDLIMLNIISQLNTIQDRFTVEKVCTKFAKISKIAPWKFANLKNILKLSYYAMNTWITLEHGNVKVRRPSLTLVSRREGRGPRNIQDGTFLRALEGIASRFGKSITKLYIGGTDKAAQIYGIGSHQLIITEDLLKIIVSKFQNVEELCFKDCGFDKDAANFIDAYQGAFFSKLKHLRLISVWCDGDATPSMLIKIVQPGLSSLSVDYVRIENNIGEALITALEGRKTRIKDISVTIADYYRVQAIDVQRYLRSLSRAAGRITVRLMGSCDEKSAALIGGFLAAVQLENLTNLSVSHFPLGRHENFDYDEAVKGLENVNGLTSLTLNGWQDMEILNSLTTSLTGAFLLESLTIRNIPEKRDPASFSQLNNFFSILKVSHLELVNIRDMNSNHLRTLCMALPNLMTLKLSRVHKVSTHAVEQCLRKWHCMEVFEVETALSSEGIDIICSLNYLPKLKEASFWMQADQQKKSSMEKLLMRFEHVDCWRSGIPDRFCRIAIRNPHHKPLNHVPDSAINYCHADHNQHFHEPLSIKFNWNSPRGGDEYKGKKKLHYYNKFS